MANNETKKKSADPLPYIIIFAILFLVALGILTWTLDMWYKQHQCALHPNIWCSDNWTCNNACTPGSAVSPCFVNLGPTGLASCLYGPNVAGATACIAPPSETGGVACDCPTEMQGAQNCFVGCASKLSDIPGGSSGIPCCCCPNTAGCPWTSVNDVPHECNYTGGPCVQTS